MRVIRAGRVADRGGDRMGHEGVAVDADGHEPTSWEGTTMGSTS